MPEAQVVVRFEQPVTAEDMRDRFQALADHLDGLVDEDQSEDRDSEVRCDGGMEFDDDEDTRPSVHVGDHVLDSESPDATMVVVEKTGPTADEYRLGGSSKTVADVNPEFPDTDGVVEVVYPSRTAKDIDSLKRYAFPVSRLEIVASVHALDEESDE